MSKLTIRRAPTPPKKEEFSLNELRPGDVVRITGHCNGLYMVFSDSNQGDRRVQGVVSLEGYGTAQHTWVANKTFIKVKSAILDVQD